MSLKDIRSECSDVAGLLQPWVDHELADEESRRVADHLEICKACAAAVAEQQWVQATLRAMEPERAPSALRSKVLSALDEADAMNEEGATFRPALDQPSAWERFVARARDFVRGGLVMVPAAAVALALFFVARGGLQPAAVSPRSGIGAALGSSAPASSSSSRSDVAAGPSATATAQRSSDDEVLRALAEVEPELDFPLQVVPSDRDAPVQLVGARLDADTAERPGARLRYRVFARDGADRHHVIDRQRPAGGPEPVGRPVWFGGRRYLLEHDEAGEPILHFERSGVAHVLRLESGASTAAVAEGDFSILLDVAHRLAEGSAPNR